MPYIANARPLVLVADPTTATAALLARQLEWAGYEAITAAEGLDALELVDARRPVAVVAEVMMPGLTGYELVRMLRSDPSHRLLAAILISARAGKLDREFAFTVGADEYFKKPFCSSELVARMTELVPLPVLAPVKPLKRRPRVRTHPPEPALAR